MTWLAEWDRRPLLQWFAGLLCAFGMVALTFGAFRFGFIGAAVGVTLLGIGTTVYMTASSTMMLLSAKREYYGRVMSIFMLSFSAMAVTVYPLGLAADLLGTPLLFGLLGIVVLVCMLVAVIVNPGFTFGRVSANPVMAVQSTSIDQSDSSTEVASKSNFVKKSQINPEKPLSAVQQSSVAINRTISRQRGSRLGAAAIQTTYGLGEISREKKINLMRGTKIGNYGLGHFLDGEATSNSFGENLSLDPSLKNDEVEPLLQSSFDEVIEDIEPDDNNAYKTKNSSQYRPDIDTDALKSFFVVRNHPSRWRKMFVVGSGAAAITAVVMRFYERVDQ